MNIPDCLLILNPQIGFINDATRFIPDRIAQLLQENNFAHTISSLFINDPAAQGFAKASGCLLMTEDDPDTLVSPELGDYFSSITQFTSCQIGISENTIHWLKYQKVDEVALVGISTDMHVLKTAIDLFNAGIRPNILASYCASEFGDDAHNDGLRIFSRYIGFKYITFGPIAACKQG